MTKTISLQKIRLNDILNFLEERLQEKGFEPQLGARTTIQLHGDGLDNPEGGILYLSVHYNYLGSAEYQANEFTFVYGVWHNCTKAEVLGLQKRLEDSIKAFNDLHIKGIQ